MNVIDYNTLTPAEARRMLKRPVMESNDQRVAQVDAILNTVMREGNTAVQKYTRQFDQADAQLPIPLSKITTNNDIAAEEKLALDTAIAQITAYHEQQKPEHAEFTGPLGQRLQRRPLPINPVGLYIPGGSAPLVSTMMMLAIPARIAGCQNIVVATPPQRQRDPVHPAIIYVARKLGIKEIFVMGGAQAIAAMAFGTETVPRCAKIYGPGNAWVDTAKQRVSQIPDGPAIDLPAGPSEALVIADQYCDPHWVAADLLSQAEHDPLAQVILLCDDANTINTISQAVASQLKSLPRQDIARQSLKASRFILVKSLKEAVSIANQYAPEHLLIQTRSAADLAQGVTHAGSVFVGGLSAESFGDYSAGPNHVLPTGGAARFSAGVCVDDFVRYMSVQEITAKASQSLAPITATIARLEGLEAHARAAECRLNTEQGESR